MCQKRFDHLYTKSTKLQYATSLITSVVLKNCLKMSKHLSVAFVQLFEWFGWILQLCLFFRLTSPQQTIGSIACNSSSSCFAKASAFSLAMVAAFSAKAAVSNIQGITVQPAVTARHVSVGPRENLVQTTKKGAIDFSDVFFVGSFLETFFIKDLCWGKIMSYGFFWSQATYSQKVAKFHISILIWMNNAKDHMDLCPRQTELISRQQDVPQMPHRHNVVRWKSHSPEADVHGWLQVLDTENS